MTIRVKLSLFLITLFIAALGNSIFTFLLDSHGEEKQHWVTHTHRVLNTTEAYYGAMKDVETGQRGYLLTEDTAYLAPYHKGRADAEILFTNLHSQVSDNAEQLDRLSHIKPLMRTKFEELDQTIRLTEAKQRKKALEIVKTDSGKKLMDDIRLILNDFIHAEQMLLETRIGDYKAHRATITTLIIIEIIFFVFLAILSFSFLSKNLFAPLHTLLVSTQKMEAGEEVRISDITPKDEMGFLLSSFYSMYEKVHKRTQKLNYKAHHDELTGLLNRTLVLDEINNAVIHARDNETKSAVIYLDLNKFKEVNDTLGHDAGDELLKETAKRLDEVTRNDDKVFRVGGDEFVVVLQDIATDEDVVHVASKILEAFQPTMQLDGNPFEISISMGVAIAPDDSSNPEELMKMSDIAMYTSKKQEASHYTLFVRSMLKRATD